MPALTLDHIRKSFAEFSPRLTLNADGFRKAAVLVPICTDSGLELLFTKRTETVERHKGQISFPGGVVDEADSEIMHTALREAEEEVGLQRSCVEVIGMLDDMLVPTGFLVTPVVGLISSQPELLVNSFEVAEVFRAPLAFFADDRNGRSEIHVLRGREREVWYYSYMNHTIWGATAMIIRSLLAKIASA